MRRISPWGRLEMRKGFWKVHVRQNAYFLKTYSYVGGAVTSLAFQAFIKDPSRICSNELVSYNVCKIWIFAKLYSCYWSFTILATFCILSRRKLKKAHVTYCVLCFLQYRTVHNAKQDKMVKPIINKIAYSLTMTLSWTKNTLMNFSLIKKAHWQKY